MSRIGATCEYLRARRRLFLEMLAVTEDLNDALAIEEVTSDSLGIIDSLIDARETLMKEVDALDARFQVEEDDAGDAGEDDRRTAQALLALQEQIDERLRRHRARVKERIKDVHSHRRSLAGYYDAEVASRPRYVDARK